MKQVLLIDAPALFRDFLTEKLVSEKINIEITDGWRNAFAKTVSSLPDLIVIDAPDCFDDLIDFLNKKRADPNATGIPVILTGPVLSQDVIAKLPSYNVIKYFNKPVKFDIFFESIGRVLRTPLSIDVTPCILETHLNNNIIFIEIAQGLNREKLALLKYKINELIDANKLTSPRIVLMLSDLTLTFIDSVNLELLLNNIISDTRIQHKHIKILSMDPFVQAFVDGHAEFAEIEVVENLSSVLNTLVTENNTQNLTEVISDKILNATSDAGETDVEMRFYSEKGMLGDETLQKSNEQKQIQVAVVDDDLVTLKLLEQAFASIQAQTETFDSASLFLEETNKKVYDLVILDIFMPGISGFDTLTNLQKRGYPSPVIVYSSAAEKKVVVQALALGAKGYLVKPLKSEAIIQKAIEVLHSKV